MAPHKNSIKRLYGEGGTRNTRHFMEEVDAAWQTQSCGANLEKAAKQQTQAAIQGLMEQVARLASLLASGQSQAPRAAPTPKQPAAEVAVVQQALAEAMASIQSLTEQVARLQSLVVQG